MKSLIRSSVESRKEELADMIESAFTLAGAKVGFSGGYRAGKQTWIRLS